MPASCCSNVKAGATPLGGDVFTLVQVVAGAGGAGFLEAPAAVVVGVRLIQGGAADFGVMSMSALVYA